MKPPAIRVGVIGCLVATLPLGCGGEEAFGPGSVTIDTIDGVLHVANRGKGQWTSETAWEVREVLRLGGPAEPEDQLFTNQLLVHPNGSSMTYSHAAALQVRASQRFRRRSRSVRVNFHSKGLATV